jgi:rhamnosyltransferase
VTAEYRSVHQERYQKYRPETTFIAYGAETRPSALSDEDPAFSAWLDERGLKKGGYYLIVAGSYRK